MPMASLPDWHKSIDQQVEEQWSKAKCKWFFGERRKRRLWSKIAVLYLMYDVIGPIQISITTDEES